MSLNEKSKNGAPWRDESEFRLRYDGLLSVSDFLALAVSAGSRRTKPRIIPPPGHWSA